MKERLLMIVFLPLLGAALSAALVSVGAYTKPMIDKNKARKLKVNVLLALDIAFDQEKVDEAFDANIRAVTVAKDPANAKAANSPQDEARRFWTYYVSKTGGDLAFQMEGPGLWGPIHGVIALDPELKTIKGITIIKQEETPGLGGRIGEEAFLAQFEGKTVGALAIVTPGRAAGDSEVDGITGATLSCDAFEIILNTEIAKYIAIIKESR